MLKVFGDLDITLQGKYPLVEVFADAPIKIAQKSIYSGGY
jgi:hypothetical protein